jgi:hypothetical protein
MYVCALVEVRFIFKLTTTWISSRITEHRLIPFSKVYQLSLTTKSRSCEVLHLVGRERHQRCLSLLILWLRLTLTKYLRAPTLPTFSTRSLVKSVVIKRYKKVFSVFTYIRWSSNVLICSHNSFKVFFIPELSSLITTSNSDLQFEIQTSQIQFQIYMFYRVVIIYL